MNEFKEKFSQLLLQYTSLTIKNPDMPPPLTNQQIFDTVEEVLRDKLNVTVNNFNSSSLKTPTNEIIVGTPNAPDVLRMDYTYNALFQKRLTSFNSMTPSEEDDRPRSSTNLSSHCEEKMEVSDTEKPSVSSNKENENGSVTTEKFTNEYDILSKDHEFKKELQKLDFRENGTAIYALAEEAHKTALKVLSKLEELCGILAPADTRPNRRLSKIMYLPPLNTQNQQHPNHHQAPACANLRTIARANALRRSNHQLNDDVPVTPTSSRPSLGAPPTHSQQQQQQQHAPVSAKKASGIVKPASKLPSALGQHNRSNSTLALTESNKSAAATTATSKSPASKSLPMRSVKYAHVQSTIPRRPIVTTLKRKAL